MTRRGREERGREEKGRKGSLRSPKTLKNWLAVGSPLARFARQRPQRGKGEGKRKRGRKKAGERSDALPQAGGPQGPRLRPGGRAALYLALTLDHSQKISSAPLLTSHTSRSTHNPPASEPVWSRSRSFVPTSRLSAVKSLFKMRSKTGSFRTATLLEREKLPSRGPKTAQNRAYGACASGNAQKQSGTGTNSRNSA